MTRVPTFTVTVLLALAGCGADEPAATPAPSVTTAATFDITGTITLTDDFLWGVDGATDRSCNGRDGYDDIHDGTQVTVTAADGKVVALGTVRSGAATLDETGEIGLKCALPFTVYRVPAGQGFYGVELAHRGVVRYQEAQLGKAIQLTLE